MHTKALNWTILIVGSLCMIALGAFIVLTASRTEFTGSTRSAERGDAAQLPSENNPAESKAKETVVAKDLEMVLRGSQTPDSTHSAQAAPPKLVDPNQLQGLNEVPIVSPEVHPSTAAPETETSTPSAKGADLRPFDPNAKGREVLPWDLVEPVPLSPIEAEATIKNAAAESSQPPAVATPAPVDGRVVESWLKVSAQEIKGEDQARPLMHFELWLAPPAEVTRHLISVAYAFSTPAIQPQSQTSTDANSGFRIRFGVLACPDTITLTLIFDDGHTNTVAIDGCRLFGSKVKQVEGRP